MVLGFIKKFLGSPEDKVINKIKEVRRILDECIRHYEKLYAKETNEKSKKIYKNIRDIFMIYDYIFDDLEITLLFIKEERKKKKKEPIPEDTINYFTKFIKETEKCLNIIRNKFKNNSLPKDIEIFCKTLNFYIKYLCNDINQYMNHKKNLEDLYSIYMRASLRIILTKLNKFKNKILKENK